jgi:predicted nucleic acid-binding Zn ribbon protein
MDGTEIIQLLQRPLPAQATEAARAEAESVVKRARAGATPEIAPTIKGYMDALELDPCCKSAYEGIAMTLIGANGREGLGKPTAEAAVSFFEGAQKRLPKDPAIQDLLKKVRGLVSETAMREPAIAKPTGRIAPPKPAARDPNASGPRRNCPYCGSPIPAGSDTCKSCQMSGEVMQPDMAWEERKRSSKKTFTWLVFAAVAAFAVVLVAGALYVRHRG